MVTVAQHLLELPSGLFVVFPLFWDWSSGPSVQSSALSYVSSLLFIFFKLLSNWNTWEFIANGILELLSFCTHYLYETP